MQEYLKKEKDEQKEKQTQAVREMAASGVDENISDGTSPEIGSEEEFENGKYQIIGIVTTLVSVAYLWKYRAGMEEMEMIIPGAFALVGMTIYGTSCKNLAARMLGLTSFGFLVMAAGGIALLLCAIYLYTGPSDFWNFIATL